jgi:MOSC domain-containing protein YiiM
MQILNLYISKEHNYVGHHGKPPGKAPVLEVSELECVADRGIKGDRYFDHQKSADGQITFFAEEIHEQLGKDLGVRDKPTTVYRRNVVTRGGDLNSLSGQEFEVQGVRFFGTEECRPCYWMDQAYAPGAENALRGNGGLRARILSSGTLQTG